MLPVCSVSPRHLLSQAQGADGPRLSVTSPHAPLGSKDPSWQSSRDTGLMELVVELMQHYSHLPLVPPREAKNCTSSSPEGHKNCPSNEERREDQSETYHNHQDSRTPFCNASPIALDERGSPGNPNTLLILPPAVTLAPGCAPALQEGSHNPCQSEIRMKKLRTKQRGRKMQNQGILVPWEQSAFSKDLISSPSTLVSHFIKSHCTVPCLCCRTPACPMAIQGTLATHTAQHHPEVW